MPAPDLVIDCTVTVLEPAVFDATGVCIKPPVLSLPTQTLVPLDGDRLTQWQADQDAAAHAAANPPPPTPDQLAAIPAQMAADNLAASLKTADTVTTVAEQLHAAAKTGIANFKADLAAWPKLTDAQKLSHVEGLMQSMVGVLQHLTGDYS